MSDLGSIIQFCFEFLNGFSYSTIQKHSCQLLAAYFSSVASLHLRLHAFSANLSPVRVNMAVISLFSRYAEIWGVQCNSSSISISLHNNVVNKHSSVCDSATSWICEADSIRSLDCWSWSLLSTVENVTNRLSGYRGVNIIAAWVINNNKVWTCGDPLKVLWKLRRSFFLFRYWTRDHTRTLLNMELVPFGPLGDFNDYLDKQLQFVTDASGFLSHDKTKYVFCLLLAYPLALLFRLLPNIPTLKVNTYLNRQNIF